MISSLSGDTDIPIAQIQLMDKEEERLVLANTQGPAKTYPFNHYLELWTRSVNSHPHNVALVYADRHCSYEALHAHATQLAIAIDASDIPPDRPIALLLPRSDRSIIAMLGSMLSGRPYVPIDPEYPPARIRYMLQDSGAALILTDSSVSLYEIDDGNLPFLLLDDVLDAPDTGSPPVTRAMPDITGQTSCYIMYTSGSTGLPKGVIISHTSLLDYVCNFQDYFQLTAEDKVLQQASISFDTSVEEIFPILGTGGQLHILKDRRDLPALKRYLLSAHISILSTTPLVVAFLDDFGLPASLRTIISGGDVLRAGHIGNLLGQAIKIYNTYGPTESTVCATYYEVTSVSDPIPIGKPFANRRVYILDRHRQLRPFGAEGEIAIGGNGLFSGYLNKPGETSDKMIADPYRPDSSIYLTGDRGTLLPDGNILFTGRVDDQLSLRGYRIEAKEIEQAIDRQEDIKDSIVVVKEIGATPVLVAYVRYRRPLEYSLRDWRQRLNPILPGYMIPEKWVTVEEFPLLPGGKIDRHTLISIPEDIAPDETDLPPALPETALQAQIHRIWQGILRTDRIGIDDSFFELGGHSLNAVQLMLALNDVFQADIEIHHIFQKNTIRQQSLYIAGLTGFAIPPDIGQAAWQENYPLTHAQERIWILSQTEEASLAYHISGALRMEGRIEISTIRQAIAQLIERHESLRTVFKEDGSGSIRQYIRTIEDIRYDIIEFFLPDTADRDSRIEEIYKDINARPFDMREGPLLRTAFIRIDPSTCILIYVMHHIISDGWSMEILLREFSLIYRALAHAEETALTALPRQFKDFIGYLDRGDEDGEEERYWLHRLSGELPVIDLPAQFPRPPFKTYQGEEISCLLDEQHFSRLKRYCEQEDATLFMGLFAILNILFYRYTGQTTTIVGTPAANRHHRLLRDQIGLFLNILPVKTEIDPAHSFRQVLAIQQKELLQAYIHHHYPMDKLVQQLPHRTDPSRSPLFDFLIVLNNQSLTAIEDKNSSADPILTPLDLMKGNSSQFDMTFSFFYQDNTLKFCLEYNSGIYSRWFAEQVARHYQALLAQLTRTPDTPVSLLDFLSTEEKSSLFNEDRHIDHTPVWHWLDQLSAIADRIPDQTAIVCGPVKINYTAYLQFVRQTAAYLQFEKHIGPTDTVALSMIPNEWLPVCLMAIWMSGAVYVPVDSLQPASRRQAIITDAACKLVITAADLPLIRQYDKGSPSTALNPEGIAYILYTSGTTGTPKGVCVTHQALLEKITEEHRLLFKGTPLNTCLMTSYCFDVSFLELLLPLLAGGTLLIPEDQLLFHPEALADRLVAHQVNTIQGTPTFLDSFLRYLPDELCPQLNDTLKVICVGGESLQQKLVHFIKEKLPAVSLNNHYGPTEVAIDAIVNTDIHDFERNIIGSPLGRLRAYVLDPHRQLLPTGAPGELYIAGTSIAQGYLNRPQETLEKFIVDPFVPGEKAYRTGDIVRMTEHRELEFIGRRDEQVKIRGLRVELDEVRTVIERHPGIEQAVIAYHTHNNNDLLIAFVIPRHADIETTKMKGYLQEYLPDYMIPSFFFPIDHIPLDNNGKIDKRKLISGIDDAAVTRTIVKPRTPIEMTLIEIWQRLLGREPIGIHDNFFDLGGNSILLIKLRAELKQAFGIDLEMKDLFRRSTVAELSGLVGSIEEFTI
jgi:amino acid adenylation domain-containing protein